MKTAKNARRVSQNLVDRWFAQLAANVALLDAGVLDHDGFHAAQRATWDAIQPTQPIAGRRYPLADAVTSRLLGRAI